MYSYINTAGAGWQAGQAFVDGKHHAALWFGSVASLIDLHPAFADWSMVMAADNNQQVGYVNAGNSGRAALWSGTVASFIDLTPAWAHSAQATAVAISQQAGWAVPTNNTARVHATLWSGSAASCVDLHPSVARSSWAFGTSGFTQVGEVEDYSGYHFAALWSGSSDSFVNLHPDGWYVSQYYWTRAVAAGGTNQVGFYQLNREFVKKAALWSGNSESFVNLHPAGAANSAAWATTDRLQAGDAHIGGEQCLAIWRGTADSFVNLGPINSGLGGGLTNFALSAIRIENETLFLSGAIDSQAVSVKLELLPPSLNLSGLESKDGLQVVTLTWTNNGVPVALRRSASPNSGWESAGGARATNGNLHSATITNPAPAQFFKLSKN